ncbi:MAG: carboxypeptidase-like regulatory domain-containing protein [Candidatus Electrothrix sp. GW3-4]|uniref:carboxypeptidase-like regulatory domain-containing protein n=1 Tax=Candidatus Electrothrix sp. GW3-4 TaxID=3126740 RepID=UPI0030D4EA81
MNPLINKKQLQNNIRTARSSLFLFVACCCLVISNNAFAQYTDNSPYSSAKYQADINTTDSGGGTWGEILNMNIRIDGPAAIFSITSKKGPFYNTNSVSIRSGSHNGPVVVAGKIPSGSEAAKLRLDLDSVSSFPQRFFATITNNIGYAWVGPVQISKNETATSEPVPWDDAQPVTQPTHGSHGPQRPIINESPERIAINTAVKIVVTAGQTQNNDMVRIQCTASSSDNTPNAPYRSGWVYSGDTIHVPLTFHSTGTQVIFCNSLDNYGATSSLSQRTITVTPGPSVSGYPAPRNEPSEPTPLPPASTRRTITSAPAPIVEVPSQDSVNEPVSIKLIAGHDPQNRDLVRIGCTADDSNRTVNDPYLSDWLPPGAEVDGTITFYSSGEKNIYCIAHSRQGVDSPSTRKTMSIRFANQAPSSPEINPYPYATDPGETTYISVTAGGDPDGDQVKVKCSATDSSITGNAPYISDWVAPQSTVNAALAFYTSGDKEVTCVTIDSKDAQSDKATRKMHVHSSQYNPGYAPDHNFNKQSNAASSESCGCQQNKKNTSLYPTKSNTQRGGITFNRPYIPEYQNRQTVFQAPEPEADLKGRVVYRSNGNPVLNARIKVWDVLSGRAYTATADYNGEFEFDFTEENLKGQIQATKGADTSVIREVRIQPNQPTVIDLVIMDKAPAQHMQRQWSPQSQWPVRQATPVRNSVWQFN